MKLAFTLNNNAVVLDAPADERVVDLLRQRFGLTGTKEGCGTGECGACTILVDDSLRLSCLMLAAQLEGREVLTVEGMAREPGTHPVQEAFVSCGAVQCGFCTPGMELAAVHLLRRNPNPTRAQIRKAISGNLCRCTGYVKIVDAVERASLRSKESRTP